jgi:phosphocarrier protein
MQTANVTIVNKLGLHARAAARFVTEASQFQSEILVRRENKEVNGKSIMGVMMLAASKGTTIEIMAEGKDENAAIDALVSLINNRFEEAE